MGMHGGPTGEVRGDGDPRDTAGPHASHGPASGPEPAHRRAGRGRRGRSPGARIAVILAGAVLALATTFGVLAARDDGRAAAPTTTTSTTATTMPPATTTSAPEPTTTTEPPRPTPIPGLTADQVRSTLTGQGWMCGPAIEPAPTPYDRTACTTLSGPPAVVAIDAAPSGEAVFVEVVTSVVDHIPWLELVAGLVDEDVRMSVQGVVSGTEGSAHWTFEGVPVEMYGNPGPVPMWTLSIGVEPTES